jgi:hypothetical protein
VPAGSTSPAVPTRKHSLSARPELALRADLSPGLGLWPGVTSCRSLQAKSPSTWEDRVCLGSCAQCWPTARWPATRQSSGCRANGRSPRTLRLRPGQARQVRQERPRLRRGARPRRADRSRHPDRPGTDTPRSPGHHQTHPRLDNHHGRPTATPITSQSQEPDQPDRMIINEPSSKLQLRSISADLGARPI